MGGLNTNLFQRDRLLFNACQLSILLIQQEALRPGGGIRLWDIFCTPLVALFSSAWRKGLCFRTASWLWYKSEFTTYGYNLMWGAHPYQHCACLCIICLCLSSACLLACLSSNRRQITILLSIPVSLSDSKLPLAKVRKNKNKHRDQFGKISTKRKEKNKEIR